MGRESNRMTGMGMSCEEHNKGEGGTGKENSRIVVSAQEEIQKKTDECRCFIYTSPDLKWIRHRQERRETWLTDCGGGLRGFMIREDLK